MVVIDGVTVEWVGEPFQLPNDDKNNKLTQLIIAKAAGKQPLLFASRYDTTNYAQGDIYIHVQVFNQCMRSMPVIEASQADSNEWFTGTVKRYIQIDPDRNAEVRRRRESSSANRPLVDMYFEQPAHAESGSARGDLHQFISYEAVHETLRNPQLWSKYPQSLPWFDKAKTAVCVFEQTTAYTRKYIPGKWGRVALSLAVSGIVTAAGLTTAVNALGLLYLGGWAVCSAGSGAASLVRYMITPRPRVVNGVTIENLGTANVPGGSSENLRLQFFKTTVGEKSMSFVARYIPGGRIKGIYVHMDTFNACMKTAPLRRQNVTSEDGISLVRELTGELRVNHALAMHMVGVNSNAVLADYYFNIETKDARNGVYILADFLPRMERVPHLRWLYDMANAIQMSMVTIAL